MKSMRTVFILAAVALGLLAYILFYESSTPSTDLMREAQGRLYEDLNQDRIDRVQITNPKGTVTFARTGGHWRIVEPVNAPVSMGMLSQLLNALELGRSTREIDYKLIREDGIQYLRRFGLVPPEIRVDFQGPDGSQVLLVGRQVAGTPNAYAKTTDEKEATIKLVPLPLRELLSHGLSEWRGRQIFDIDQATVRGAAVSLPSVGGSQSDEVEVRRSGDRSWQMRKPVVTRADHKAMLAWVGTAMRLGSDEFVSDENANLTAYGLATPAARLSLFYGPDNAEETLLLGAPVPDKENRVYAKLVSSPTVFTIDSQEVYGVLNSLGGARDRALAPLDIQRVTRVQVDQAEGPDFDVTAVPTGWAFTGGETPANATAVFDLINAIAGTQVAAFVKDAASDLSPYGLDHPRAIVAITAAPAAEGRQETQLLVRLGKMEGDNVYVTTSEGPFIYAVPATLLNRLPRQPWDWRSLAAIGQRLDKVRTLTITNDKGARAVLTRQDDGSYTANIPGYGVDSVTADQQAALLTRLRALRWLGPAKPEYGLDNPVLRFDLLLADGTLATLKVGRELPTLGRAAQIEGDGLVFELDPADYRILGKVPLVHLGNEQAPLPEIPSL